MESPADILADLRALERIRSWRVVSQWEGGLRHLLRMVPTNQQGLFREDSSRARLSIGLKYQSADAATRIGSSPSTER